MRTGLLSGLCAIVLACSAPAQAGPPQYRAVNETRFGKAWVAQRQDAPTVAEAVRLTLADAAVFFGTRPKLGRAYEDSRTHRAGGATFTVDVKGGAVNGWMTCEVGSGATKVAVAVIRADAPRGEWQRLVQPAGGPSAGAKPATEPTAAPAADRPLPAPAHASLRRHVFEDGVASAGLADGWTTPTRAAMDGVLLLGKEGQSVWVAMSYPVQTPRSSLASLPGTLVAPYSGPLEALQRLHPQVNRRNVAQGGSSAAMDHLRAVGPEDVKPNGRAVLVRYGVTERRRDGSTTHFQVLANVQVSPTTQSSWMFSSNGVRAPDAIFERDLPLMLQLVTSVKWDDAAVQRATGQRVGAQQQWFANQQAGYRAQQAANDAQHQGYWNAQKANAQQHQNWEDGQLAQDRRNDNYSELMRGYRTVEDTQTGERRSVDYLDVDEIVGDLNKGDPDRYRQIPLRDELHPVGGG